MSGWVTFDGVLNAQYLIGSESWGTYPDMFQLWVQPQGTPVPSIGTLSWGFNGVGCTLDNCLVESAHFKQNTRNISMVLLIKDRRWMWANHTITYYSKNEQLISLVQRLFAAIGEPNPNLSAIDPNEIATVDWDHCLAADELQSLLYRYGYCVSPNGNGPAVVWKIGSGVSHNYPEHVTSLSISLTSPSRPERVVAFADKTAVQSKLMMLPIGIDLDGQHKPIEWLSYAPAGGWSNISDWDHFSEIPDENARALAAKTVGKLFRVSTQADGSHSIGWYVPNEVVVTSAAQYLPLMDTLLTINNDTGKPNKAICEATYYYGDKIDKNSASNEVLPIKWTLDKELGILEFEKQILVKDFSSQSLYPSIVYFECSYSITHNYQSLRAPGQKDRMFSGINTGGVGVVELDADEIRRKVICSYYTGQQSIANINDNAQFVSDGLRAKINSYLRNFPSGQRSVVFYRTTLPISTDGVTQQVVWKAGMYGDKDNPPWSTMVSINMESHPHLIRRKEREYRSMLRRKFSPERSRGFARRVFELGGEGVQ